MSFWEAIGIAASVFNTIATDYKDEEMQKKSFSKGRGRPRKVKDFDDLEDTPSAYRIRKKRQSDWDYIGATKNTKRRLKEHRSKYSPEEYDYYYSLQDTVDDAFLTEKRHIKKHKPSNNKYRGGNGRR